MKAFILFIYLTFLVAAPTLVYGGGISVDAGLTPAQDRLILRSQLRYLVSEVNENHNYYSDRFIMPIVAAYGVRPGLTLMLRNGYGIQRTISNGDVEHVTNGFQDPFLMGKYRLLRINQPDYILGIAPTLGIRFPAGHRHFSPGRWRMHAGIFTSLRIGPWAVDFTNSYQWFSYKVTDTDFLQSSLAIARQFILNEKATATIAPVLEVNYRNRLSNDQTPPLRGGIGSKFTIQSFILEALYERPLQFPAKENVPSMWLIGVRYML